MSDTPQGPGWWQASDDKWYPPPRPDMGDAPAQQPPAGPPSGPYDGPPMGGPPSGGGPPGYPPGSPYGGMPMQPGPPGQGSRTALFVVLGILGAAALVGLIFLLVGGDDDSEDPEDEDVAATDDEEPPSDDEEPPPSDDEEPPSDDEEPPSDDGGGGGGGGDGCTAGADSTWDGSASFKASCDGPIELNSGIEVVEYGFSSFPSSDGNSLQTAFGAIVENTSDEVVNGMTITVSMYDSEGGIVASEPADLQVINGGQTLAIGAVVDNPKPVDEIEFQGLAPGEPLWEPGEGSFEVADVSAASGSYSGYDVIFEVTSTFGHNVNDYKPIIIYRDSEGGIIAGESAEYDFNLSALPADSTTTAQVESFLDLTPVDVDLNGTEVYVDCAYTFCNPDE